MSIERYLVETQATLTAAPPPPRHLQARFLYLTKQKFEDDLTSTPHFHPFSEILFVVHGRGRVALDDRFYPVSQGDLVIVNPNQLHTEFSAPGAGMECVIIGVDDISFDSLNADDEESRPPTVYNFSKQYDRVLYYYDGIYDELTGKRLFYQTAAQNILMNFIIFLLRNTGLISVPSENKIISKECAFVKQYLDSHYALPISLEELAQRAFISEGYLIRSFKKYFGISPMSYLKNVRIAESETLLTTTDLTVTDIARQTGFSSSSHFSQAFKQSTGRTPHEYRLRNRQARADTEKSAQ